MGKLDNTQKAAIYQSWKDGTSPKELAKQYAISIQAIYQLINKLNHASAEVFGAEPTQAPESTIETGAISSVVLADTTVEQNPTESADAARHTAVIPQSVLEAIAFAIGNNAVLINNLTEQITLLTEKRETIKQQNAELTAWMKENGT